MVKPFSLQTVLELMQVRADEATNRLARLIANERDAKTKLEMLQQYRGEYATRFQQAAQNGLRPNEWHNFQDFLKRIDDAIDAQSQTVKQEIQNTASGQAHWQQQRIKLKAFDTLSDRHFANEEALQIRREQKTQDEFASRLKSDEDSK
jgi:flagellar FliJ protein